MAVGAPLFERIRATGASQAACDSETCRWQIAAADERTSLRHPVEILAEAYAAGDRERAAPAMRACRSWRCADGSVILVIGAGAVGSFLGWTLARGGEDVELVLRRGPG